MKRWIVFDLDGTLTNIDHRIEHALVGNWQTFEELCGADGIYEDVAALARSLGTEFLLLGVTGRSEARREVTQKWLLNNGIMLEALLMRPEGDFSQDAELKVRLMEEFFASKDGVLSAVLCVFEDRERVVVALRDYGLTVCQVREGQF